MRTRLHLCIASGHLRLDLLQPVRSTSMHMACQMLWAYLRGQDRRYYQVVGSATVKVRMDVDNLLASVQQALNQLELSSQIKLAGSALEVELGPTLARVGLLELDGQGTTRLARADLNAFAKAWVSQTWGLDPTDHIIRISPLKNGRRYVLVCVSQTITQQLSQWCSQHGLQFTDCKPALVVYLNYMPVQATKSVLVLTENATDTHSSHIAQFVVTDENGPLSISRIWMGAAHPARQDAEITQMVLRMCAQHQFQGEAEVHRHTWPFPADVMAQGSIQ